MSNPVTYAFSTWQPDATGNDSNHPVTALDPMNAGSSNDAAGWVRLLESQMRRHHSVEGQWEQWLGIKPPYAPSPNPPLALSSTQFTLTGDWTNPSVGFYPGIIFPGRRIKAYINSAPAPNGIYGTVRATSVALGLTTVTVLWDGNLGLDSSLREVQFGTPAPGLGGLKYFFISKAAPQTFSGTSTDTDFIVVTKAFEFWIIRLMIYLTGGGGGGGVTLTPLVPAGAGFRFGVPGYSGAVSSWVSAGGINLAGNNPYWTADIMVQTAGAGGNISIQYSSASIVTGVEALSTMMAQQGW